MIHKRQWAGLLNPREDNMKFILAACMALVAAALPALAGEPVTYSVHEDIEDVLFSVENEIIGRGLKIDSINHVSTMLDRTAADVGAANKIYRKAEIFNFCSATLSREMMAADPKNINYCPYRIFVYATAAKPDVTVVGHDTFPEGPMKKVENFLDGIVRDALGLD